MSISGALLWRDKAWVPTTPNGTNRYELLTDMWALYDFFERRYAARTPLSAGSTMIKAVCAHQVLTHAQLAKLTGRTRQRMHIYMQENSLPLADDQGARGLLCPEYVDWLKEMIVRKFIRDEYISDEDIATATNAGSDSLVSVLTGIPTATLKNVRMGYTV